jgi:hypothetical protein
MDFVWEAITSAGEPMIARTRHHWILAETGQRYLRLRRFEVSITEPYTVVTPEQALAQYRAQPVRLAGTR